MESTTAEAHYQLRKILALAEQDFSATHLWLWEGDRWRELVFALLARVSNLSQESLHDLAERMSTLGLLDVESLASVVGDGGVLRRDTSTSRHALELMREHGLPDDQAARALLTLGQAALGLQQYFAGKVQRYLRQYGETMLRDLGRYFAFSELSGSDVQYAFTYWLQNVAAMPLSLLDPSVSDFAARYGLKPDELMSAADDLDVNLALVDDLVRLYLDREEPAPKQLGDQPETTIVLEASASE